MSDMNLIEDIVAYSKLRKQLQELENKIKAQVLEIQQSQKIGDVTVTYYQPSKSVDYEGAARAYGVSADVIAKNTHIEQSISWKGVCEDAFITPGDLFITEKPARVTIK